MTQSRLGKTPSSVEHETHSVIEPPRNLAERAITGGSARDVARILAEAEHSLASLRQEFPAWMASELSELESVLQHYKTGAEDGPHLLFRKVHDMRGHAATLGFPLAGRAADNLCKLLDALQRVPDSAIETHLHTIRIIIREKISIQDHPVALEMVISLEDLGQRLIQKALDASQAAKGSKPPSAE
jgi:hypothetical protein